MNSESIRKLALLMVLLMLTAGAGSVGAQSVPSAAETDQVTLAGNAIAMVAEGNGDSVEVAAFGTVDYGNIPIIVRNSSDAPVVDVVVKVEARDGSGALIGVGQTLSSHALKPYLMNPGDLALGFVYIEGELPPDSVFSFSATSSADLDGFMSDFNLDVEFGEVTWLGDRIVGELKNTSEQALGSTYLMVTCLAVDGTLLLSDVATIDEDIPPGATTSFQMNGVFGDLALCENFLIAGTGHPS